MDFIVQRELAMKRRHELHPVSSNFTNAWQHLDELCRQLSGTRVCKRLLESRHETRLLKATRGKVSSTHDIRTPYPGNPVPGAPAKRCPEKRSVRWETGPGADTRCCR